MGLKLLVVDDSRFQLHQLELTLSRLGCEVTACLKPEDVLIELEKSQFDCVFSDLLMPGLDGFELVGKIREKYPKQVVVVLTANIQKTAQAKCDELGVNFFINKPPEADILNEILQKITEGASQNEDVAS